MCRFSGAIAQSLALSIPLGLALAGPAAIAQPADPSPTAPAATAPRLAGTADQQGAARTVTGERSANHIAVTTGSRPTDSDGDAVGSAVFKLPLSVPLSSDCSDPHFCLHWVTVGVHATTDTQVARTKAALARSWAVEVDQLGFRAPLNDAPNPDITGNPDDKIDIYLGDLMRFGLVSYCLPDVAGVQVSSGHCSIDNDFAYSGPFTVAQRTAGFTSMNVFELVAMAYTGTTDRWLTDSTALWMSDQVYPDINLHASMARYTQIANPYTSPDFAIDPGTDSADGWFGWPLVQFLGDRYGPAVIRSWWDARDVDPVTIHALTRALPANNVNVEVAARFYAMALTLQPGGFKERALFGKPVFAINKKLTRTARSTGRWEVTNLGNFASMAIRVVPDSGLPRSQVLRIFQDSPYSRRYGSAMMRIQYADGRLVYKRLTSYLTDLPNFHPASIKSVVIVTVNDDTRMRDCGSGTPLSCGGYPIIAGTHQLQAYLAS